MQRCRSHHYVYMLLATGMESRAVAAECLRHAADEQVHVDLLAERIRELGGEPNLTPALQHPPEPAEPGAERDPLTMIRADLAQERNAIDAYAEIIRCIGDQDPWTRITLERILAGERQHGDDLISLLHMQGRAAVSPIAPTTEIG